MDADLADFTKAYIDSEITRVDMITLGNKSVYIRKLCRADIVKFGELSSIISGRMVSNIFNINKLYTEEDKECDLQSAEDFLVFKSLCNSNGCPLFETVDQYKAWSKNVKNECIDEILFHIDKGLTISFDPKDSAEELKKNNK